MADTLQKPDRELNMWPISFSGESSSHDSNLKIIGLSNQYLVSEPIEVQVQIMDSSFNCGDLYLTIYSSGTDDVITQGGFFNQCIENGNLLPNNDTFSQSGALGCAAAKYKSLLISASLNLFSEDKVETIPPLECPLIPTFFILTFGSFDKYSSAKN